MLSIRAFSLAVSNKRVISSAKEKKQKEWANDLNDSECQNEIFRMAKQMVKERQDITGLHPFNTHLTALFREYPGEPVPERQNQSGFY